MSHYKDNKKDHNKHHDDHKKDHNKHHDDHKKDHNKHHDDHKRCCVVDDKLALKVQTLWQRAFSDAALLPVIGFPSNSGGVLTLTHTDGSGHNMRINGLPSKSPLANNALYSAECSKGRYLNLYEIMIPD